MAEAAAIIARLERVEVGLTAANAALDAHRQELVSNNDRFAKLLADLTEQFRLVQEQQLTQARELAAVQEALAALHAGRGGTTGLRLVDTRVLDKPGKLFGKVTEWRDWKEGFLSFCGAADEALHEKLEEYAKRTTPVPQGARRYASKTNPVVAAARAPYGRALYPSGPSDRTK